MRINWTVQVNKFIAALMISIPAGLASASPARDIAPAPVSTVIQKTTSGFLAPGQWRLGFQSDYGVDEESLIGTELPSLLAGALNIYGKIGVWHNDHQRLTFGTDLVYASRQTLLWGGQRRSFDQLDILGLHPRLIFTQALSDRLLLHSAWEGGIDRGKLRLSEQGKKRLWRSKYPNGDYEARSGNGHPPPDDGRALEEDYSPTHRSVVLQSVLGLAQERFELTGEILRSPRETLLVSAHIARFSLEDLKARRLGLAVAQQWRSPSFGFRLGIGVLYQVLSGHDFDEEAIDDARFLPTTDLDAFFVF